MWFPAGELSLGGLITASLTDLSLDFTSHSRWTITARIWWEYRPTFSGADLQGERYQLTIPLQSGDLYAWVYLPTGTSSGSGDGDPVSLKGDTQLWATQTTAPASP